MGIQESENLSIYKKQEDQRKKFVEELMKFKQELDQNFEIGEN
jgi:hypothetical protein